MTLVSYHESLNFYNETYRYLIIETGLTLDILQPHRFYFSPEFKDSVL